MQVHRITGRHYFVSDTGAAIWLDFSSNIDEIQKRVIRAGSYLGIDVVPKLHPHKEGIAVSIEFAPDLLYTACEILEWAVTQEESLESVEAVYSQEKNEQWRDLHFWAQSNGIAFVEDEDGFTLGLGKYAQTWALSDLPIISSLVANQYKSIPCVYVTGTNGKTTTSRMLSSMVRSAGFVDGLTSSDGVLVDGKWVAKGDWTGPGAARMVLRHPDVEYAVLETARGGLMRRGLVITNVDAVAVTNVSNDHLGQWGLHSVADMARAKLTVALGLRKGGTIILNADCSELVEAWEKWGQQDIKVIWFSTQRNADICLQDNTIIHHTLGTVISIEEIPLTLGGTALHNVENAMVAIGLAVATNIPVDAIRTGLRLVTPDPESSRGRSNWYRLQGADIILDFAHNPEGIKRMVELGNKWKAKRKFIFLGQAGDRDHQQVYGLAKEAVALQADGYIIKELPGHAYGVSPTKVAEQIKAALQNEGIESNRISIFKNELHAVRKTLNGVQNGDLILLIVHENLDQVIDLLMEREATVVT